MQCLPFLYKRYWYVWTHHLMQLKRRQYFTLPLVCWSRFILPCKQSISRSDDFIWSRPALFIIQFELKMAILVITGTVLCLHKFGSHVVLEIWKHFSCSTQLSIKFVSWINDFASSLLLNSKANFTLSFAEEKKGLYL